MSGPLEDAWHHLFDDYMLFKMDEWSARTARKRVRQLVHRVMDPDITIEGEDGEERIEAAVEDFLRRNYKRNMPKFNALLKACSEYQLMNDGSIARTDDPKDSILHAHSGGPQGVGSPNLESILSSAIDAIYTEATHHLYEQGEAEYDFATRQRDTALLVDGEEGVTCHVCRGDGETFTPARYRANGDQIEGTGVHKVCNSCKGEGYLRFGGATMGRQKAAMLHRWLVDADDMGWKSDPTPREIEREMYNLRNPRNPDTQNRNHARLVKRAFPDDFPEMEGNAPHIPSIEALEGIAKHIAGRKRLLGDPHDMSLPERRLELMKFRAKVIDILTWGMIEKFIYPVPANKWQDAVEPNREEKELHEDNVGEIRQNVLEEINSMDLESGDHYDRWNYEQILQDRISYHTEADGTLEIPMEEVRQRAMEDFLERKMEIPLYNYFRGYVRELVNDHEIFKTNAEYLTQEGLDLPVGHREKRAGELHMLNMAKEWMLDVVHRSATEPERSAALTAIDEEMREEDVDWKQNHFDPILNSWEGLSEKVQKAVLDIKFENRHGDRLTLLGHLLQRGAKAGNFPRNSMAQMASAIYANGTGLIGSQNSISSIENYLSQKHAEGRRHRYIEQTQDIGGEGAIDEAEAEERYDVDEDEFYDDGPLGDIHDEMYEEDTGAAPRIEEGERTLKGLDPMAIPTGSPHIIDIRGDDLTALNQKWDTHMGRMEMHPFLRPVRDGVYLELLQAVLKKKPGTRESIYTSQRQGELNKQQADELLRQLSGLPEEGPDRRFWVDRLLRGTRFATGVKPRVRFGKQESNFRDYQRMALLTDILLDPKTRSVRNLMEVANHPSFQRLVDSDLRRHAMKGLTAKEKEQLSESLATEEYHKGTLQKCDQCDDAGRSFATGKSCRHVEGELGSPEAVQCSGTNQVGASKMAGMLTYMHPRKPGTIEAKMLFEKLQHELLGKTTYTNDEGESKVEVGAPDRSHSWFNAGYGIEHEKGLLQQADEYDKKFAMRIGHMVLCPACHGSADPQCEMCKGGDDPFSKEEGGKSYVADTRILRDANFRSSGISDFQSLVQLEAKERANDRIRESFAYDGRESIYGASLRSSLLKRMIPVDEGVNPVEVHPIFFLPELTNAGGFLTRGRLLEEWHKAGNADAFIDRYRRLFQKIPDALEGSLPGGFGAGLIRALEPVNAVDSTWFQRVVHALNDNDIPSIDTLVGQIYQGDTDNRNMMLDEGLMEMGACSTCNGSGYAHWPDGRMNESKLCPDCKGTKSEGVRKQIARRPEMFEDFSDEDIRIMHARGDLDYEHRGTRSILDNAHLSPSGKMCEVCQCGHHDVIREGDHTTLSMMMKGRSHTPPKRSYHLPDGRVVEVQDRTKLRAPTMSPVFSRDRFLIPTRRRNREQLDRQNALYTELFELMNEVKALGSGGDIGKYGKGIDPITRQPVELSRDEMDAKIDELVDKIRNQDVRDAWNERMGRKGALPDLNLTLPAVYPPDHEKAGQPKGEEVPEDERTYQVDWRHVVSGLGMVSPNIKSELGLYDPRIIPEDVITQHPCPYCARKAMHHGGTMDIPTLEDHLEEGRARGEASYEVECPVSAADWQKIYDDCGGDVNVMEGVPPIKMVNEMIEDLLYTAKMEPHLADYENLMDMLEPSMDEAWAKRVSHDPFTNIMKVLKPSQSLGIPIITPVPPALIMGARLSTMGGGNPFGRGHPMSPTARLNQMLPESFNASTARLRAAEEAMPHSDEGMEQLKRLLAMHIIDPNLAAHNHKNPLGWFSAVGRDGGIQHHLRKLIDEGKYLPRVSRALWAIRVLRKNLDNVALTPEEQAEFRQHHHLKLRPFLALEKDWQDYLTPRRKQLLQQEMNLQPDEPVLNSIFHFPPIVKAGEEPPLFAHFGEGVNWRGLEGEEGQIGPLDFVFDALNRSAVHDAIDKTSAHFDADEHGFMQPYENHPSVWGFWHEMRNLPNPELFHKWVAHEELDDSYNTIMEGPNSGTSLWNVTGKSLGEILEDKDENGDNLMDILWKGVTGGKGITRLVRKRDPDKSWKVNQVMTEVMDGKKFPDMDTMLKLSTNESTALKGAWFHLRNEIVNRASFPEFSKQSMQRAGHNQAPIGLNTLGTATRCLSCHGHGIHHTVDEAAKWHAAKLQYHDEEGRFLDVPTVVERDAEGKPVQIVELDGTTRDKRVPLPMKAGTTHDVNWAHPDSMRFIREELRPRHLGHVGDDWDESEWDKYIDELTRHYPSLADPEFGGMDNILPAHEFACIACQGTGHCGSCDGAGQQEHERGVSKAIQDINMALVFMKNLGVGIIADENGKVQYQPRAAHWLKSDDGAVGRFVSSFAEGQKREFEPEIEDYVPMDPIGPDDRPFEIGSVDDWHQEQEEAWHRIATKWARDQLAPEIERDEEGKPVKDENNLSIVSDDKKWAQDMLRTIGEIKDDDSLRDWATEYFRRKGERDAVSPNAAKDIVAAIRKTADDSVGSFQNWQLDRMVHDDPLGYLRTIRGAKGAQHGWPGGSFNTFMSRETGKSMPLETQSDFLPRQELTNTLQAQLEPEALASLLYSLSTRARALVPGMPLRPSWWTDMHESGFNKYGMVFPRGHFGDGDAGESLPTCEHPHCEDTFRTEGHACEYCEGTGDMSHNHEGASPIKCFVCDGEGVRTRPAAATYGPDKPGEFYNPHGHYCSHHHGNIMTKMEGMFEDSQGQKLRGHYRRIVGGEFARRLIKYTTLNASDLGDRIASRRPGAFPDVEYNDTGLSLSHLGGLMFIGFHGVRSPDGGGYLIPMFERNGSKFSIFDLGEGHVSDWQGLGRQPLFQRHFGADGVYLGRGIDYFDHPGWGDADGIPTNAMGMIKVKGRDDDYNLHDIGVGEDSGNPYDKNQYAVKNGQQSCPCCKQTLNRKAVTHRSCARCGAGKQQDEDKDSPTYGEFLSDITSCVCRANGEEPIYEESKQYIRPCKNKMVDSPYLDDTKPHLTEGQCNWPGHNYDFKYLKEFGIGNWPKQRLAREYLVGRTAQDPPEHIVEKMHRERLRDRLESIVSTGVDPAIDPATGKMRAYPERQYVQVVDHKGNPIHYPDSHPMAGQEVYRSVEMPVDQPLCTWYKFTGVPTLHGQFDERIGGRMDSQSFIDAFYKAIVPYDKHGNPLHKEVSEEDERTYWQLTYLLSSPDANHPHYEADTGVDGRLVAKGSLHFRIPVMHPGFGSSLGHSGKLEEDGYQGFTNPHSLYSLVRKVNDKLRISSAKADAAGKEIMAKIAAVDNNKAFTELHKIGRLNPDTGDWVFSSEFVGFVTALERKADKNKNLDADICKELMTDYTEGNLHQAFATHGMSEQNKRMMIRAPRGRELLEVDDDLTAYTVPLSQLDENQDSLAKRLLAALSSGNPNMPPLTKEGADPSLVEFTTGDALDSGRPAPLTFGIRPDYYHEALEKHAEEAHEKALEFQVNHFPFQASMEARARGQGVMDTVDGHLTNMTILNAKSHRDVIGDNQTLPKISPDDEKQWFIHTGQLSTEARKRAEATAESEWRADDYREGFGDTSSTDYQGQYDTDTGDLS